MKQNKTKKPLSKGMKIFLDIAMVVSLLVAGFSAWNIVQVLKGYQESKQAYEEALTFFENNDRQGFIDAFHKVRDWFGDYSEQFLKESRQLLQQANDLKQG